MLTLDPDLWLYSRLTLGRGWRLLGSVTIVAIGTAGWITLPMFNRSAELVRDARFLPLAFLLLMIGPPRGVARLMDLENGGLLDQTRMTGRPSRRVLLMFLIGSTWPFLIASLMLLTQHIRVQADPGSLVIAAVVFVAAVDVALMAYGTLPADMTTDSRFFTPLLLIAGFVALNFLVSVEWIRLRAFGRSEARATFAVVAAALPLVWWLACRRLERPAAKGFRAGARHFLGVVSRLVPRAGAPELTRQLRSGLLSGGTLATILVAPLSIVLIAMRTTDLVPAQKDAALNAIPFLVSLIAWFAVSSTVRGAIDSGTIDLVRVTPQRAEAITLGWYAGIALPYWIATLLAGAALWLVGDRPTVPLAAIAIPLMIPAVSLAEGLQRRRPGTYLWFPLFAAMPLLAYGLYAPMLLPPSIYRHLMEVTGTKGTLLPRDVYMAALQALPDYEWRTLVPPFPLNLRVLVPVLATVVALGAAAGRIRRLAGPSLSGPAAAAAVCAVVIATRMMPLTAFPHALAGILVILASFAAEEGAILTRPWTRVGVVAGAAFGAVVLVTHQAAISWSGSLVTAIAAASALGAALLIHEMTWQIRVLSLALRSVFFLAVQGWTLFTFTAYMRNPGALPETFAERSAAFSAFEVGMLVTAFVAVAAGHTFMRTRSLHDRRS